LISASLGLQADWLTLNQGLFIAWAVLNGLSALARIVDGRHSRQGCGDPTDPPPGGCV
jgi:hypothetical protein